METLSNGRKQTLPGDVRTARVNENEAYRRDAVRGAGERLTRYMVTLADGRERRVYVLSYGNGGATPHIMVRGERVYLDDATVWHLETMAHTGEPYQPCRPTAELVAAAKVAILADVEAGHVPSTVATFSELHDYVDANMYGDDGELDLSTAEMAPVQDAVHEWIVAGGIRATVTDDETIDAVNETLNDGFAVTVGDLSDGDPVWAGICERDGEWYGREQNGYGQSLTYRFGTEEIARVWLGAIEESLTD